MFTEQLHDLHFINNLTGNIYLDGDINTHFNNPLRSLTKQTLITISLYYFVKAVNKPTYEHGHVIDMVVVRLDDNIHR